MRQLRFVTRTEDGGHLLVETADGLEQFGLQLDATLRVAVTASVPPPTTHPFGGSEPPPGAHDAAAEPAPARIVAEELGPRDIQVQVRAGASPQDLADAHGMSLERVLRFAAPVVAERHRITDEAQRARSRRTGTESGEPKVVVFGEAVVERFAAYGIDTATVEWDSRRREDGEWVVVATWIGGDDVHEAEWLFHRTTRTVTPLDDAGADLLSDRPIRPAEPPAPNPSLRSAPALAPGVIAFPPFPDAHTGPVPVLDHVFDQDAPAEGPRNLPPYLAPPAAPESESVAEAASSPLSTLPTGGLDFEEPPLPLAISAAEGRPAAASAPTMGTLRTLAPRRDQSEDDKASRARVPSWDDILLGVRRKQD